MHVAMLRFIIALLGCTVVAARQTVVFPLNATYPRFIMLINQSKHAAHILVLSFAYSAVRQPAPRSIEMLYSRRHGVEQHQDIMLHSCTVDQFRTRRMPDLTELLPGLLPWTCPLMTPSQSKVAPIIHRGYSVHMKSERAERLSPPIKQLLEWAYRAIRRAKGAYDRERRAVRCACINEKCLSLSVISHGATSHSGGGVSSTWLLSQFSACAPRFSESACGMKNHSSLVDVFSPGLGCSRGYSLASTT